MLAIFEPLTFFVNVWWSMEIIQPIQCILQLKYFTGLSERLQRRAVSDKWLTWGSLQSSRGNRPVSHEGTRPAALM